MRVGTSRVRVFTDIVASFSSTATPQETIQQQYPALSLEEVYGAIAWCLADTEGRLLSICNASKQSGSNGERRAERPSPVIQRLRALRSVQSLGSVMSRPRFLACTSPS